MGLSPLRNRGLNWGYRLLLAGGILVAAVTSPLFVMTPKAEAAAGINQQMNFQGRLYNTAGNVVPDGYYNLEFKIYQDGDGTLVDNTGGSPAGTLKWTEDWLNANSQGVRVQNGFLSVQLGSINPFGSAIDWNQDTLWLSMNIAGIGPSCTPFSSCSPDGEMLPMKRMSATAYALNAQNANTLNGKNAGDFVQNTTSASLQTNTSLAIQSSNDANETAYLAGRATQSAATLSIKQGASQTGEAIKVVDDSNNPLLTLSTAGELAVSGDSTFSATLGIGNAAVAGDQLYVKADTGNVGIQVDGNGTDDIADFRNGSTSVAKIGNEGQTTFQNSTDSTNALNVKKSAGAGGGSVFNVDTTNGRIGVNNDAPDYAVDVTGDVNIDASSAYKIDGTDICTAAGCTPASGSSYYIQNTTTPQTANIAIISDVANPGSEANASLLIKQALGQTGDLLRITDNNDVQMGNFDQYGNFNAIGTITASTGLRGDVNDAAKSAAIIRQLANAATEPVMIIKGGTSPTSTADLLQLQNSNGDRVAGFDKDGQLLLGKSSIANGSMKLYNDQGSGSITIKSGNTTGDITLTLPTALGSSGDCLKASDGSGALGFASCSNGVDTIGTFDGTISYDDGAQISGTTLTFGAASGTKPGIVSTIAQTFAGDKTFVGKIISQNTANSTNALSILTASSGTNRSVLNVDTTNERVTIGAPSASANAKLDVYASSQTTLRAYQNGTSNIAEFSATSRGVGTVDINGTTTLSGTSTKFLTTLQVGSTILVNSGVPQLRTVTAIASDTSLTVGVAFTGTATGLTFNVGGSAGAGTVDTTASSAAVSGTGTSFTTAFRVGDSIAINGEGVHVISAIASDTSLTLADTAANTTSGVAYSRANFDPLTIKPTGALGVNTLSPQAALHVQSPGVGQVGMAIQAANGQTANLFNILAANGTVIASINKDGDFSGRYITSSAKVSANTSTANESALTAIQSAASATAPVFVVKNTGATPTATADLIQLQDSSSNPIAGFSKDGQLYLGRSSNNNGSIKFLNNSGTGTFTIQSGNTTGDLILTLPTTLGAATDCLQNDGTTAGTLAFGTCGVKTIDTLDHVAKSTSGAVITGTLLTLQSADNVNPGLVTSGASVQTMGINKTFQNADVNGDSTTAITVKKTAANGGGTVFNVDTTNSIVDTNGTSRTTSGAAQTTDTGTFKSANTSGIQTNGVNIDRNGAGGTTTNGLNISQTAGTLTNGIAFNGTIGTDINHGGGTLTMNGNTGISFQTGGTATTAGTTVSSLSASGAALFQNITDSANAFQVQSSTGTRMLNIDTSTMQLQIGDSAPYVMRLPGASGAYASTPDTAANSVTGNLDLAVRVAMTDWTPTASQDIMTKNVTTGNQVSFRMYVSSSGTPHLLWSADGSTTIDKGSTASVSATDGQTIWLRATLTVNNGGNNEVRFYTAPDGSAIPSSWTQLGSTVTTAGATSIFNSTSPIEIGSRNNGTSSPLNGSVYRALMYNGIAGTLVNDFNPTRAASVASTTFTASTGETWTRNGTAVFLASTIANFSQSLTTVYTPTLIKNASDSASAFQVQTSAGVQIMTVDTSNSQVILGKSDTGGVNGKLVFLNSAAGNTNSVTLVSGTTTTSYNLVLPTSAGAATDCLQNDGTTAGTLTFATCGVKSTAYSGTSSTNGGTISGTVLTLTAADGTNPGLVSTANQTFSGNKTFQNSNANGDSVTALNVLKTAANGGASVFDVDTTNSRVGIKNAAPSYELDVTGTARFTTSALSPLFDTVSGGTTLGIGQNNATSVGIAKTGVTTTIGGVLAIQDGTATAPGLSFNSQATLGVYKVAADTLGLTAPTGGSIVAVVNSNKQVVLNASGAAVASGGCYNFSGTANDASATSDTGFCRDGVGTVGLRSGTTAQTLSIYNTYTNSSNYERANIGFSGNVFNVGTQAAGTGTGRNLAFGTNGTTRATFDTSNNLYLGPGTSSGAPGTFTLQATASSTTAVTGGTLQIQGGNATTGNADGGNLKLMGGTGAGTGVTGLVVLGTPTFNSVNDGSCYIVAIDCAINQSSVNSYSQIIVSFTTSGKTATLPDPSTNNSLAGRLIYITAANGSSDFTLQINSGGTGNLVAMRANTTATMVWNGSKWTAAGASSSTTLQAAYDNTLQSAGGAELVVSKTTATNGLTIRDSSVSPVNGALVSIQSSSAATLFAVNSNLTEYASNPGAETAGASSTTFAAGNWSAAPLGGTVSRYVTAGANIASGTASVQVSTAATAGQGAKNTLSATLIPNNHYNVSFSARLASGTFTDMDVYYSIDGSANSVLCTSNQAIKTSINTKVNCSFTAPSSGMNSSNAIFIRQTTGVSRIFYIDNLSVTIAADYNLTTDSGVDDNANFNTNYTSTGTGATVSSRITSDGNTASSSAEVAITTGGTDRGIKSKLSISPLPSTLYRVSVYARQTVGAAFTDFKARYTRDGGTNFADCVDYSTQTLTSSWAKITCYVTTDSTAATTPQLAFVAASSAARTFRVDDVSITLASPSTPNVQIGGGITGGPTTLFTLDKGASAPISGDNESLLGSMYYDTTLGKLQCYEADGWGACGSSPDNIVTISPEYTNAVMHGTGVGTMVSDFCSSASGININDGTNSQPTICGANESYNFYRWTSPQASAQAYSIYVTYQLPTTFKAFASGQTNLAGRVDSLTNASIKYEIFRNHAGSALTSCSNGTAVNVASATANVWDVKTATGTADPSTCGFVANDSIVFKITLTAASNGNAYVGNLGFTFSNK